MKLFKVRLYYYIGHVIWMTCMKYWYVPGSYIAYRYFMGKSSDLDTDDIVWSKPLAGLDKDDL